MRSTRSKLHCGISQRPRTCVRAHAARAGTTPGLDAQQNVALASPSAQTAPLRTPEELPSEEGIPFFGTALEALDPSYPSKLPLLFEKHGSDAINLNLGPYGRFLAFQSPQAMHDVSVTHGDSAFAKWPGGVERLIIPEGKSLTNKEALPWRAILGNVMSTATVMQLQLPLMVSVFTATIEKHLVTKENSPWWASSRRMTFAVACRSAVGDVFTEEDIEEMFPLGDAVFKSAFSPDYGLAEGVPFTMYWRGHQAKKKIVSLVTDRLEKVLENREKWESRKSVILKTLSSLEEEGLYDPRTSYKRDVAEKLARETVLLMFAGTDATSFAMSTILILLAENPEWVKALNEEQDRLVAEFGDDIDRKVISRSAVALAVIQESLRVRSALLFLYRRTLKDLVIDNVAIPAGTDIAMCPNKAIIATGNGNPNFDPQQWLSEDRTECASNNELGNFQFGKGPRSCVGRNLAMAEMLTFLAILGRKVSAVEMSEEEIKRPISVIGSHPTGLPTKFVPRTASN